MSVKNIVQISPAELEIAALLLFAPNQSAESDSHELRLLVQDLLDTMHAHSICVGLAATQIGVNARVAVVNASKDKLGEDLILINPVLVSAAGKKDIKHESCMSLPDWKGDMERRDMVIVSFEDILGTHHEIHAQGFLSRVIQHELDHIQGRLYAQNLVPGSVLQATDLFQKDVITEISRK